MPTDQDTVLITGCSSGIGRASALEFREEGWRVYATARDETDIEELADAGCETASLDVTDDRQVNRVAERIEGDAGRIDCLVNNAGYAQLGAMEDVPTEKLQRQFDVNVFGPHRLIRAFLPHMRAQGEGTIVNVSSVVGRVAFPLAGAYCGSKFAMEGISDALRPEVAGQGVDVVLVEPGPVDTSFDDRVGRELDDIARSPEYEDLYHVYNDMQALGDPRPGSIRPQDVAEVIVHAASCPDPAPRYPVGRIAKLATLVRFVPAGWRDAVYRLATKLPK